MPSDCENQPASDAEIARRISKYLREHPQAGDTLEGIVTWWLLQQRVTESTEAVLRVLKQLKAQGIVCERKSLGNRTLYVARQSGQEKGH
jgi:Fe2+ or Zn2+ uptake regulation protein